LWLRRIVFAAMVKKGREHLYGEALHGRYSITNICSLFGLCFQNVVLDNIEIENGKSLDSSSISN
jgi:hypothetical protein